MRLVIKLGGTLLESEESLYLLALEVANLAGQGHRVVVVHGGGKQLTRYLAVRGIESEFVKGFRVTPPETLKAVIKVLAGEVNLALVEALQQAGAQAVGLTGADAGLVEAVQLSAELGAVGRIERVRPALLEWLTAKAYVPVVACLAAGARGETFNGNADQMAVAIAAHFLADRLIFLTDVEGVLDEQKRLIPELDFQQAGRLIREGVATGGMQAKLEACCQAVRQGLPEVQIGPGSRPRVLAHLLAGRAAGTPIAASQVAAP